ncbi:hypothetical protein Trydic_g16674 [Trypoxylus dichotomus]
MTSPFPNMFYIYTNNQATPKETEHFLYTDDLAIAIQGKAFEEVEGELEYALNTMTTYYRNNPLKLNPSKTQVTAFRLNTRLASRKLNIHSTDPSLTSITTGKHSRRWPQRPIF